MCEEEQVRTVYTRVLITRKFSQYRLLYILICDQYVLPIYDKLGN